MAYSTFSKYKKQLDEITMGVEPTGLPASDPMRDALYQAFCDSFMMYFKCHSAHWNVMGDDFHAFHIFFKGLYEEVYDAIDLLAEQMRQIGATAPFDLDFIADKAANKGALLSSDPQTLARALYAANAITLMSLNNAYKVAQMTGNVGAENVLQNRITAHKKHAWMLRSTITQQPSE